MSKGSYLSVGEDNYDENKYFQGDVLEEDLSENARTDNIGKPIGLRCSQPYSDKKVHNGVLIDYIDHGRGYKVSHCKSYSGSHADIEKLRFHTEKDYNELKKKHKINHLDWIYYIKKIHPGLKPHQKGFWYAYTIGNSKKIHVHNGIFDYVVVSINSVPTKIYDINEAKKHGGKIIELHYTHYILNPSNSKDIIYRPHSTASDEKVIDLGLLPSK